MSQALYFELVGAASSPPPDGLSEQCVSVNMTLSCPHLSPTHTSNHGRTSTRSVYLVLAIRRTGRVCYLMAMVEDGETG